MAVQDTDYHFVSAIKNAVLQALSKPYQVKYQIIDLA